MKVYLHRLRERGWPIPRYQFAFKPTIEGELTLREERDQVLNRSTRIAKLAKADSPGVFLLLRDAQLVEITAERMVLSGIEREENELILKVEDFAQTWICWTRP